MENDQVKAAVPAKKSLIAIAFDKTMAFLDKGNPQVTLSARPNESYSAGTSTNGLLPRVDTPPNKT
jgi:hypothetical protein